MKQYIKKKNYAKPFWVITYVSIFAEMEAAKGNNLNGLSSPQC